MVIVQNEGGYISKAKCIFRPGAETNEISSLEGQLGLTIPDSYREFLSYTNGAVLFKEPTYEQWGCVLLGTDEIITITKRIRKYFHNIPQHWVVYAQWLGDCDILLFDLHHSSEIASPYIIDGDTGLPVQEWKYIHGDFSIWLDRLIVAQGAKYWRWL